MSRLPFVLSFCQVQFSLRVSKTNKILSYLKTQIRVRYELSPGYVLKVKSNGAVGFSI